MTRYVPPSIDDIGIRAFLDGTKHKHDGYDFLHFQRELAKGQNISALARTYRCSWPTMKSYVDHYVKEYGGEKLANISDNDDNKK